MVIDSAHSHNLTGEDVAWIACEDLDHCPSMCEHGPDDGYACDVHIVPTLARCNCEHIDHDSRTWQRFGNYSPAEGASVHPYGQAVAGKRSALFVGLICDACADGHMSSHLVESE